MNRPLCLVVSLILSITASGLRGDSFTSAQADAALERAIHFFHSQVASDGGYLWRYASDLSIGEGESEAKRTTIWVQPPGTPSVGQAILSAHERTGNKEFLEVARDAAYALVNGQLQSGGWDYRIEFADEDRTRYAYRSEGQTKGRNETTLDDDTTQSAIRFLMHIDQRLQFQDAGIHGAAMYALDSLLKAQYPNGAWPQRYSAFPDASKFPVRKASYPESWPRSHPDTDYRGFYTLNDNTLADMIATMLEAAEIFDEPRYREAAKKGGGFLLLAQMPAPQPAWAQQYNTAMHPAWARRFEPASVTGGESQGAIRILLHLYRETGDAQFLESIPMALDYLEQSKLPDGRLARFYELQTNRPLFFTKTYQLTYSDDDLPTHYSFKSGSSLASLRAEYRRARAGSDNAPDQHGSVGRTFRMTPALASAAEAAAHSLDARGAWVTEGRLRAAPDKTIDVIDCRTFIRNVDTLSRFVAASRGAKQ